MRAHLSLSTSLSLSLSLTERWRWLEQVVARAVSFLREHCAAGAVVTVSRGRRGCVTAGGGANLAPVRPTPTPHREDLFATPCALRLAAVLLPAYAVRDTVGDTVGDTKSDTVGDTVGETARAAQWERRGGGHSGRDGEGDTQWERRGGRHSGGDGGGQTQRARR
jgi:hypothetical protein